MCYALNVFSTVLYFQYNKKKWEKKPEKYLFLELTCPTFVSFESAEKNNENNSTFSELTLPFYKHRTIHRTRLSAKLSHKRTIWTQTWLKHQGLFVQPGNDSAYNSIHYNTRYAALTEAKCTPSSIENERKKRF